MTNDNKPAGIQSLQIGLNILEILANHKEPLKFTDIQNSTSMTKSNLYKYLTTLVQFGLIHRNPDSNAYSLGYKLIQLGNAALEQSPILEMVIPYLKNINEKTNLTALLALPSKNGPLVSYISSAYYGINIGAQIGTHLPHHTSTGSIFLAFSSNSEILEWRQEVMSSLPSTNKIYLEKELEISRMLGFATKIEPLVQHVSSFSVPLLNYNRDLIGAITIVGYTEIIPKTKDHPTSEYVIEAAKRISELYGCKQWSPV
ncbi:Glycerol operon regulatory protein [Ureibacillus acetophenoni]